MYIIDEMSKEDLNRIKQIIDASNQNDLQLANAEKAKWEEAERIRINAYNEKIKADQIVLDNSGIKNLFIELRDSGFVKKNNSPVYEKVPVYKKRFFGGEEFDHYEERKVADYEPAIIKEGPSSISLEFNYSTSYYGDGMYMTNYSEVTVVVKDGKLQLKHHQITPPLQRDYDFYTPIEDGKLIETVAEAIRNPIRT